MKALILHLSAKADVLLFTACVMMCCPASSWQDDGGFRQCASLLFGGCNMLRTTQQGFAHRDRVEKVEVQFLHWSLAASQLKLRGGGFGDD
eukprot:2030423-Rhodomonas_salina.1